MMKSVNAIVAALSVCLLCACGAPPKVVQGSVISLDPAAKIIVVRDECAPNLDITLSFDGAEIGAEPQVNDLLRVSYTEAGGRLVANRLMNLTKQHDIGILSADKTHKKCKGQAGR